LTWKIEGNIYFYTTALKIMARVFLFFPLLKKKKKNHPPEEENGKSRVLYTRHCAPPPMPGVEHKIIKKAGGSIRHCQI
jgi:hypothetical protein